MKKPLTLLCALPFAAAAMEASAAGKISGNEFNPAISLTLDGRYTDIDSGELELPGFQLGGEAGLPENGFSTGHNELTISANVDDKFFGMMTAALVHANGETELELEEAYIETLGLGNGLTVKGGRFLSGMGYLNSIHAHAHDFADSPLVYDAMFGGMMLDTGVQVQWLAPTDFYLSLGAEVTTGSEFPGGDNEDNNNGQTLFIKTGGDFSESSSWQLGLSRFSTEFDAREAGAHDHGGHGHDEEEVENALHHGELDISGIDFVYKWAPNGNAKQRNFKLQAEYFIRNEEAEAEFAEGDDEAAADYDGEQKGYYVQAVYQFMPKWRVGLRHESLSADNSIANYNGDVDADMNTIDEDEFLEESGLETGDDPTRNSIMVDYSPSHFSRVRLQYNTLDNGHDDESNDMITLQYIMTLGAHGAHSF